MSKTITVHVRYKSLYISLPSSGKQQREMTMLCVVYRTWTTSANFLYFHLDLNAVVAYLASAHFWSAEVAQHGSDTSVTEACSHLSKQDVS